MGKKNVASGNDRVDLQAGQIHGKKGADRKAAPADTTPGRSENVRSGNAQVGRQADEIRGGLRL